MMPPSSEPTEKETNIASVFDFIPATTPKPAQQTTVQADLNDGHQLAAMLQTVSRGRKLLEKITECKTTPDGQLPRDVFPPVSAPVIQSLVGWNAYSKEEADELQAELKNQFAQVTRGYMNAMEEIMVSAQKRIIDKCISHGRMIEEKYKGTEHHQPLTKFAQAEATRLEQARLASIAAAQAKKIAQQQARSQANVGGGNGGQYGGNQPTSNGSIFDMMPGTVTGNGNIPLGGGTSSRGGGNTFGGPVTFGTGVSRPSRRQGFGGPRNVGGSFRNAGGRARGRGQPNRQPQYGAGGTFGDLHQNQHYQQVQQQQGPPSYNQGSQQYY